MQYETTEAMIEALAKRLKADLRERSRRPLGFLNSYPQPPEDGLDIVISRSVFWNMPARAALRNGCRVPEDDRYYDMVGGYSGADWAPAAGPNLEKRVREAAEAERDRERTPWHVIDGVAFRPSDNRRVGVAPMRTVEGYRLWMQLGRNGRAAAEVNRRMRVRVMKAWGDPSALRGAGHIQLSVDGGEWHYEEPAPKDRGKALVYVLD